MFRPKNDEGVFFDYKNKDLSFKEIYNGRPSDTAFVKLYRRDVYVTRAYVYCDAELFGREYVVINHEIVYLDTIKTLVPVYKIIEHVAKEYRINALELGSKCKEVRISDPRNILYYILRDHYELKYQDIADLFHKRAHATVMSGRKKTLGYMEMNTAYREHVQSLILTELRNEVQLETN